MMEEIKFDIPNSEVKPKGNIIKVMGVGGCGGNAVDLMFDAKLDNVDFIIANTDKQALHKSKIPNKLQLGVNLTRGLGAGCDPLKGRNAALESKEEIKSSLSDGTELLFITAGMGGGTGTGASPIVAEIAQELGILTIGVVTRPFHDELYDTEKRAYDGIMELSKHVDSLLIIDNQKIYDILYDLSIEEGFEKINGVLLTAVKGIVEIINCNGIVNVDLADLKRTMTKSGMSFMGMGQGVGADRAKEAASSALKSPLLHECDLRTVQHALVNFTTHPDHCLKGQELKDAMEYILSNTNRSNKIKRGIAYSSDLEKDTVNITIIATGFKMKIAAPKMAEMKIPEDDKFTIEGGNFSEDSNTKNNATKPLSDPDILLSDIDLSCITVYSTNSNVKELENEPALIRRKRLEIEKNKK